MSNTEFETQEIKVKAAIRVKPGDRWTPLDNKTVILESLTECLEYIYQKNGNTQFFMDAKVGFVYVLKTETIKKQVEPEKKWSLYGEY